MNDLYLDNNMKKNCNGCGACVLKCPKKCIKMVTDGEGFLYPEIDESKCIKCNICRKVCSNFNDKTEENERAYIAINNSDEELKFSSSGGMFFILAEYVMKKNGVVFGVTYNENMEVVHDFVSNSLVDCKKFCGSKYVRSNLQNSYDNVRKFLDEGRYVLFTGTPCQVNGLKKYLGKNYEKLILCDIICHANPSPKIFKLYIKSLEIMKEKKVVDVLFRSKKNGWKSKVETIKYEDGEEEISEIYSKAFSYEIINRPSCYSCVFASKRRISDITIGDFWGIENIDSQINANKGVSLLTINSPKGSEIFDTIKERIDFKEVDYEIACRYNHYKNVLAHRNRERFFKKICTGKINEKNLSKYLKKYTKVTKITKFEDKIYRRIKK